MVGFTDNGTDPYVRMSDSHLAGFLLVLKIFDKYLYLSNIFAAAPSSLPTENSVIRINYTYFLSRKIPEIS